jgi:hypothetical protein
MNVCVAIVLSRAKSGGENHSTAAPTERLQTVIQSETRSSVLSCMLGKSYRPALPSQPVNPSHFPSRKPTGAKFQNQTGHISPAPWEHMTALLMTGIPPLAKRAQQLCKVPQNL